MPKRTSRAQHPSSPGLAGAASVDQYGSASFPSSEGAAPKLREETDVSPQSGLNGFNKGNLNGTALCNCWTAELDDFLRDSARSGEDHEKRSIDAILRSHPAIAKSVIWERIVYLGLTERTRQPYDVHKWTDVEDRILLAEYGNGREGAHGATVKILALHPEWTHDAVARRAHALGVTNHRVEPARRWDRGLDETLRELADCSLDTIARRLRRTPKAILARIRRLGFDAAFFGGHKTKDLIRYLNVSEAQVKAWVHAGWLMRKHRRITDESLAQFCREHSDMIPFESLTVEAQNWVRSLGYQRPTGSR
ncbi:MAG: hypothetical protein ABL967_16120 [Bryobacteraceae bacterium]